ncbi:MAG: patatin-like phospholipase family protein [Pseudomonadota bacterium]
MAKSTLRPLSLALQGGGAHGAFTWGVLERLSEEPTLKIEGISATSAGAMNAAVFAQGMTDGGPAGARAALAHFWERVAEVGQLSPIRRHPFDWVGEAWGLEPFNYMMFNAMSRLFSPYQLNPFNWNPLREILEQQIDFERLARSCGVKLFISATNVRSGKNRVFHHNELSPEVLLASACLPFLFQAVEIDGEAYWDGGYMGNPAIYPLIYQCSTSDVAIVQINPVEREEVPTSAVEILDRVNEISFNSTLMREMRAIAFVTKLIDQGALKAKGYKRMNIHLIEDVEDMKDLGVASKLSPEPELLLKLRDLGRNAAERWLEAHLKDVGVRSSLDIADKFL